MPLSEMSTPTPTSWSGSVRYGNSTVSFTVYLSEDPVGTEADGDEALQAVIDLFASDGSFSNLFGIKGFESDETCTPTP
jgi:hypothetical protein